MALLGYTSGVWEYLAYKHCIELGEQLDDLVHARFQGSLKSRCNLNHPVVRQARCNACMPDTPRLRRYNPQSHNNWDL